MTDKQHEILFRRIMESGYGIKELADEISTYSGQQVSDTDIMDYLLRRKEMSSQIKGVLGKLFNINFFEFK